MTEKRRSKKLIILLGVGLAIFAVVGVSIWQIIDRNEEVQVIESKLGFEISVVEKQSHEAWWAATRTYRVKPEEDKDNSLEYLLYLNKENKIEQWAEVKDGDVQNIKYE
ncbi:hypothetical protein [Bacillus sp. B1-b2]|uniref:hypothetical protein n=1 Tax=Bacillus sp. B1-b2 TaxID=2653201 RepID=UPI0012622CBB|nr:hypothetical protein [Bacillus sp. B1-b2]KAB7672049.1 hypothetical protein F9279_03745 [Bacillus sp. B1-b2]